MSKPRASYAGGTRQDSCQTPPYAALPILPLVQGRNVWEPACGDEKLSTALSPFAQSVIPTDLITGYDFLTWQPDPPDWDVIVTNPPYSARSKLQFIARCYELGRPFALLMQFDTDGNVGPRQLFDRYGVHKIVLDTRIDFYMPNQGYTVGGAQFSVAWFVGLSPLFPAGRQSTYHLKHAKLAYEKANGYVREKKTPKAKFCEWTWAIDSVWVTSCATSFDVSRDTLTTEAFRFCPACRKPITEVK